MKDKIDHILVRRFVKIHPGWLVSIYPWKKVRDLLRYEPVADFVSEAKRTDDAAWHFGRVRFFYDQIMEGVRIEPIMIDNVCSGGYIYPEPVLVDGSHRLAAHWFAKEKTIPAHYSGRLDLLSYLTDPKVRHGQIFY